MPVRSIKGVKNLRGLRVLVRVDFNVPIKGGRVADDSRLKSSLPTIQYLTKAGARVILISHLGRPEGKRIAALSLLPIAKRLSVLLGKPVHHSREWQGPVAKRAAMGLKNGSILLLENIRFSRDESGNKGKLAKTLASLGDVFVMDGFAVAHRGDASVVGIPKYIPSYAGLLLAKEIDGLSKLLSSPTKPFVAVIGGAKMETKVPVIRALLPKMSMLLLGGGIVNTALKAAGYGVGDSLVDEAHRMTARSYARHRRVVIPIDVIVGKQRYGGRGRRVVVGKKPHVICKKGEAILDIGPATIRLFSSHLKRAKTILWNGAMGYFELKPFDTGTKSIARLIAARSKGKAFGVIGGGETLQVMQMIGMSDDVDLVSTGGGAMLEFLAMGKLPGIEALKRKK